MIVRSGARHRQAGDPAGLRLLRRLLQRVQSHAGARALAMCPAWQREVNGVGDLPRCTKPGQAAIEPVIKELRRDGVLLKLGCVGQTELSITGLTQVQPPLVT